MSNPVFSSFMPYHRILAWITRRLPLVPEFTSGISVIRVAQSLFFCAKLCGLLVVFVDYWLSLWTIGCLCGLLVVFLDYWLSLWTIGCLCGLLVVFVDYWLSLWTIGCLCGLLVVFLDYWLSLWTIGCLCGLLVVSLYLQTFLIVHMDKNKNINFRFSRTCLCL